MQSNTNGKLIILSAPSGSGKTTIMKYLVEEFPQLEFSISATSRAPRHNECHGRDYYFVTADEFEKLVSEDKFVEWEEVYKGTHYGTLRSEMERIHGKGNAIVFDVDVKGGLRLKKIFGGDALAVFVMPPSVEELRNRLELRGTDSAENIEKRVAKAEQEIADARNFDVVVVNDDLAEAVGQAKEIIRKFLND